MGAATNSLAQWSVTLGVVAMVATVAHCASFGAVSRELNYNSIPGGDNEESNMVEPAPFASLSDFLSRKQGAKKTDDAARMKALVKALYALDALDKKMAQEKDDATLEEIDAQIVGDAGDAVDAGNVEEDELKEESTSVGTTPSAASTTTAASTTVAASTTTAAPASAEPTTEAPTEAPTAAPQTTPAPTLVHDSEVNEFVDEIAKHISTFFQGILHYFDGPGGAANATVVIELEEKSEDGSAESSESDSDSDSKEEVSTEEVPKWLVQMFESVAALPHGDEDRSKEFRPKESLESEER
nr:PREDICTED: uncharacterized protein LOC109030867 [Bemisia tabaci]